jgi:hypothetical protein
MNNPNNGLPKQLPFLINNYDHFLEKLNDQKNDDLLHKILAHNDLNLGETKNKRQHIIDKYAKAWNEFYKFRVELTKLEKKKFADDQILEMMYLRGYFYDIIHKNIIYVKNDTVHKIPTTLILSMFKIIMDAFVLDKDSRACNNFLATIEFSLIGKNMDNNVVNFIKLNVVEKLKMSIRKLNEQFCSTSMSILSLYKLKYDNDSIKRLIPLEDFLNIVTIKDSLKNFFNIDSFVPIQLEENKMWYKSTTNERKIYFENIILNNTDLTNTVDQHPYKVPQKIKNFINLVAKQSIEPTKIVREYLNILKENGPYPEDINAFKELCEVDHDIEEKGIEWTNKRISSLIYCNKRRNMWTSYLGWSLISLELLKELKIFFQTILKHKKDDILCLEVGCGNGIIGNIISAYLDGYFKDDQHRVQYILTDPLSDAINCAKYYSASHKLRNPVKKMGARNAIEEYDNADVLVVSWPPYRGSMGLDAISTFASTKKTNEIGYAIKWLILITEGPGGCTGTLSMHAELSTNWKRIKMLNHLAWPFINDMAFIFKYVGK